MSPSARKVWIEIPGGRLILKNRLSPSARKVWIEIMEHSRNAFRMRVAFRKEGVD